ncbi:sushi, von Willebrand factor type A, EGF and pentraxin domain-containing protein 1-like [Mya arenaria]|nr:sushi, von Willebrand factor type A, EGF and pentraxin domain-containing protein 1-like [Mya arenaria]
MVTVYADESKHTGTPRWNDPKFTDNEGIGGVNSEQVQGPRSATELGVGDYTASVYPRPYTSLICPSGKIYGSSCFFSCANGTELTGPGEIKCEKFENGQTSLAYGLWSFGTTQPFCELTDTCQKPDPPENGALACDTWAGGKYCIVQCREGFVIEDNTFESLLTCSDHSGTFSGIGEDQIIPSCTVESSNPFFDYKIEEFYYFDGNCITSTKEIQEHFIEVLLAVLGNVCSANVCDVESVEVICPGSDEARRRRSSDSATVIVCDLAVSLRQNSQSNVETAFDIKTKLFEGSPNKGLNISSGSLIFEGRTVSNPELSCPLGSYKDNFTLTCVECRRGTFHRPENNRCEICPRGMFQPLPGQTKCDYCPLNKTTERMGAVHFDECIDACPLGYVSANGAPPCSPCDTGNFASTFGSVDCSVCPGPKTTKPGEIAISADDCYDFDLHFPSDSVQSADVTTKQEVIVGTNIYLRFWLKCSTCHTIFKIYGENDETIAFLGHANNTVELKWKGCVFMEHLEPSEFTKQWQNLVLEVNEDALTLILNAHPIISGLNCSTSHVAATNLTLQVGGDGFSGRLTSFNVWDYKPISGDNRNCFSENEGNIFSWKQFADAEGHFAVTDSQCDDYDNCQSEPCLNGGSCYDRINLFTCACIRGFDGVTCEQNIDDCDMNSCQNEATCVDGIDTYTCSCGVHYTGDFCEILVVNGSWSAWGDWGECSVTCGSGQRSRYRQCDNPVPANGGFDCVGENKEVGPCALPDDCINECNEDPEDPENGALNCSWTSKETKECFPFCQEGFAFDSDEFIDHIECGPNTGFTWNIRNEDNPKAQIPSCTEAKLAEDNIMVYAGEYEIVNGDPSSAGSSSLRHAVKLKVENLVEELECVASGTCNFKGLEVVSETDTASIRKRSLTGIMFVLRLSCSPNAEFRECYDILEQAYYTLQNYVNQTLFTVNVNGVTLDIVHNGTFVDGEVNCSPGTVQIDYFCVPCGSGNYPEGFFCERCPRGTYQDEIGKLDCKPCPDSWTTAGMQTRHVSLCNVPLEKTTYRGKPLIYILIISASVASFSVVVLIGVWCYCKLGKCNKYDGKRPNKVGDYPRSNGHPPVIGNIKYAWGERHHGHKNADVNGPKNDYVERLNVKVLKKTADVKNEFPPPYSK